MFWLTLHQPVLSETSIVPYKLHLEFGDEAAESPLLVSVIQFHLPKILHGVYALRGTLLLLELHLPTATDFVSLHLNASDYSRLTVQSRTPEDYLKMATSAQNP
jgi:hypothetical protein